MRIVIEMEEGERAALKAYCTSLNIPYSQLFRILLKLSLDGTIPRDKLESESKAPRPVFNVSIPVHDTKGKTPLTYDERIQVMRRKSESKSWPKGTRHEYVDTPEYKEDIDEYLGITPTPPADVPRKKGKR